MVIPYNKTRKNNTQNIIAYISAAITIIMSLVIIIGCIMFMEYRYIMENLAPYKGENGTVYIEFMGHIDEYYAADIEEYYMMAS